MLLKIRSKTLLNMKMVVKYLNFVFHIEVKTKSNYKIFNFQFKIFVFQFINNTKWHFGYTDSPLFVQISEKTLLKNSNRTSSGFSKLYCSLNLLQSILYSKNLLLNLFISKSFYHLTILHNVKSINVFLDLFP